MKPFWLITALLAALGGAEASAAPGTDGDGGGTAATDAKAAPADSAGAQKKSKGSSGDKDAGALQQTSVFGGASLAPYRGSQIVYRNLISAVSLDPSTDLTYNPYYAMSWGFQAWWWFTKKFYVRASIDVDRELTESDVTTYADEALLGDLVLGTGLSNLWTVPKAKINLSLSLLLSFGTSKASQARTFVMGIGPGIRLSRGFSVLKGMSVGYSVRVTPKLHRYTTGELESPLVPGCRGSAGCDSFWGTGRRNSMVRVSHYADFSIAFLEWLGVSLAVGQAVDWLYPLGDSPEELSLRIAEPENRRWLAFIDLSVAFQPLKMLEIVLGYSAVHPLRAPDSTYYVPFFNRYSALYLELKLKIDGLVTRIKRSVK